MSQQTVVVKQFGLSRKEIELRNKLFGNSTDPNNPHQSNGVNSASNQKQTGEDVKMDIFLKQMENEFKTLNKSQVTMGSLNTQTQLIRQQNDALDANQKQLQQMMGQIQNEDQVKKQKQELMEQNRKIMQDLLGPINAQILEIKKTYEETKESSKQAKLTGETETFQKQNEKLKSKLSTAQREVDGLLQPEPNSQTAITFNRMTNVNLEIYQKTIQHLKSQIEDLQKEAHRAEIELEERQLKLNNLPKQQEMLLPIQEHVQAYVENIDFLQSQQLISFKLGGEFEYQDFSNYMSECVIEADIIWRDYLREMEKHMIEVPKLVLSPEELAKMQYIVPSILDSLKVRMGLDPKVPMKDPHSKRKSHLHSRNPSGSQNKYPKVIVPKPKNLLDIRTQPAECQEEVEFELDNPHGIDLGLQYNSVLPEEKKRQNFTKLNSFQLEYEEKKGPTVAGAAAAPTTGQNALPQSVQEGGASVDSSRHPSPKKDNLGFSDSVNSSPENSPGRKPKKLKRKRGSKSPKKSKIDEDLDEELKEYIKYDYDDAYEQYLKKKMNEKPKEDELLIPETQNRFATQSQRVQQFNQQESVAVSGLMSSEDDDDDEDDEDYDDDDEGNNGNPGAGPAQMLDRNTIKGIFLDILKDNKDKLFGGRNVGLGQPQQQQQLNIQSTVSRRISDRTNENIVNMPKSHQSQQGDNNSKQSDNRNTVNQNQGQSQLNNVPDLGLNFLNIINQTLAQVSSAVSTVPRPPSETSQAPSQARGQSSRTNQQMDTQQIRGGVPPSSNGYQNFQNSQFPSYGYPVQQQQQQPFQYGSGMMPTGFNPTYMHGLPPSGQYPNTSGMMQAIGHRSARNGGEQEKKINLTDFYQEFELSDSGESLDGLRSSMSIVEGRSFAESIFEHGNDNSRSIGQVSVEYPEKKQVGGRTQSQQDREFAAPKNRKLE